jgi:GTPase SAR1 family protein
VSTFCLFDSVVLINLLSVVQAVTIDEGEALAREYKMAFFETSAFNDINVDEAFMRISKEVFQRLESAPPAPAPIGATKATTTSGFASTSNTKAISSANFTPPPKKSSWCLLL